MSHYVKILPALIFGIFLTAPAHASSLTGDLLQAKYYVPDINSVYDQATVPSPFTVGSDPDPTITVEGVTTLLMHFSDAALLITLNTTLANPMWGSAASQNGPGFSVLSGNPFPAIAGVTSSNAGPVSAYLSNGMLFVNWAGMSYHDGDTVTVTFAPVPLPATLPLFAGGLGCWVAWLGDEDSA